MGRESPLRYLEGLNLRALLSDLGAVDTDLLMREVKP